MLRSQHTHTHTPTELPVSDTIRRKQAEGLTRKPIGPKPLQPVSLNNGLDTGSEPDEGSYNHVSLHDGECLDDRGHQTGLDALSKFIGMSPKYARDKIAHKHKICPVYGVFTPMFIFS